MRRIILCLILFIVSVLKVFSVQILYSAGHNSVNFKSELYLTYECWYFDSFISSGSPKVFEDCRKFLPAILDSYIAGSAQEVVNSGDSAYIYSVITGNITDVVSNSRELFEDNKVYIARHYYSHRSTLFMSGWHWAFFYINGDSIEFLLYYSFSAGPAPFSTLVSSIKSYSQLVDIYFLGQYGDISSCIPYFTSFVVAISYPKHLNTLVLDEFVYSYIRDLTLQAFSSEYAKHMDRYGPLLKDGLFFITMRIGSERYYKVFFHFKEGKPPTFIIFQS
jgi:hypothetical protein